MEQSHTAKLHTCWQDHWYVTDIPSTSETYQLDQLDRGDHVDLIDSKTPKKFFIVKQVYKVLDLYIWQLLYNRWNCSNLMNSK